MAPVPANNTTATAASTVIDDIEESHLKVPTEAVKMKCRRKRGRPPLGAIFNYDTGVYELPLEAIEAAAERMIRHRTACRERYTATRQGLRMMKPELFKRRKHLLLPNQTLVEDGSSK